MEYSIYLSTFILVTLIIYSLRRWISKGEIFHPGLIYVLVNGGIFIIFAFGPYNYLVDISWYYCLMYSVIITFFTLGVVWGESCFRNKSIKLVKDIYLEKYKFLFLFICLLVPKGFELIARGLASGFNLENAAALRLYEGAVALESQESNLVSFFQIFINYSYTQILSSLLVALAFKKKKYFYILLILIVNSGLALLSNSRSLLIFSLILTMIPIYTVLLNRGFIKTKNMSKNIFSFWKKYYKIITLVITLLIISTIIITNVRSKVQTNVIESNVKNFEIIEAFYKAEKKLWFASLIGSLPNSIVNPLAELSLYAGGTVASGSVTTRIAIETNTYTWGLRNFFVFHRILSQLHLEGGFSDFCRENLTQIRSKAIEEVPAILTGWLGEPGNWIMDFGIIGSPLAAMFTGIVIGYLYRYLVLIGPIIGSVANSVFSLSMLITPSISFFGTFLSNFISFCFFVSYILLAPKKRFFSK